MCACVCSLEITIVDTCMYPVPFRSWNITRLPRHCSRTIIDSPTRQDGCACLSELRVCVVGYRLHVFLSLPPTVLPLTLECPCLCIYGKITLFLSYRNIVNGHSTPDLALICTLVLVNSLTSEAEDCDVMRCAGCSLNRASYAWCQVL